MTQPKTTSKFTAGPWEVWPYLRPDLDDDPMAVYRLAQLSATKLTKAYFAAEPETEELKQVHAENQANARLIAKAPEMYELVDKIANPPQPRAGENTVDLASRLLAWWINASLDVEASRIKAEIDGE